MNKSSIKRVVILGAGGHAHVAAEILRKVNSIDTQYSLIGFLDDNKEIIGRTIAGKPVLGLFEMLAEIDHDLVFIAIGNNRTRKKIFVKLVTHGEKFLNLVHPSAILSSEVKMGQGVMIAPGVIINPGTEIGDNVILNTGATVDHHNRIADHVHIAPGAHLGGDVSVGEGSLVGIGSVVIPQQKVGIWSIIAAGAVVTKPIGDMIMVAGVPAREIKKI